jgi:hypothetical protein
LKRNDILGSYVTPRAWIDHLTSLKPDIFDYALGIGGAFTSAYDLAHQDHHLVHAKSLICLCEGPRVDT